MSCSYASAGLHITGRTAGSYFTVLLLAWQQTVLELQTQGSIGRAPSVFTICSWALFSLEHVEFGWSCPSIDRKNWIYKDILLIRFPNNKWMIWAFPFVVKQMFPRNGYALSMASDIAALWQCWAVHGGYECGLVPCNFVVGLSTESRYPSHRRQTQGSIGRVYGFLIMLLVRIGQFLELWS